MIRGMKKRIAYLGAAVALVIVVAVASLSFCGVLGSPSSSSDVGVPWRSSTVSHSTDVAVLWRSSVKTDANGTVAVLWRSSVVANPLDKVAVLWRSSVTPAVPAGAQVAVLWRSACHV